MSNGSNSLPIGDIQFYDDYLPSLTGGTYTVGVSQTISGINTGNLDASQDFLVVAPQFNIDPGDINTEYPPQNHTGQFGDVLPHIVMDQPMVPWEREMSSPKTPWMALLVFSQEELMGDSEDPTKAMQGTVADFMATPASNVFRPSIQQEQDVAGTDPCYTIQVGADLVSKIFPRLDELPYLTHVRQLNTGDKAIDGLSGTGWYSVVVANRFPKAIPGDTVGQLNIAHLVSLEGMENYLVDSPNFGAGIDTVELVSLARWSFRTLPDNLENFKGLITNMVAEEDPSGTVDPAKLWLRLDGSSLSNAEAKNRLAAGYVPMSYHVRSGEDTFAWYRGPLAPILPEKFVKEGMFATLDSAIIYDATNGIFDLSLAGAWQAGRALALSDKSFGANLMAWRRQCNALVDRLESNLEAEDLDSKADIQAAASSNYFQKQFETALQTNVVAQVGNPTNSVHGGNDDAMVVGTGNPQSGGVNEKTTRKLVRLNSRLAKRISPKKKRKILKRINAINSQVRGGLNLSVAEAATPKTVAATESEQDETIDALKAFMATPSVQSTVLSLTQEELSPVADWLAQKSLLYGVPFNNLVAASNLLPDESMRFFYLDQNWVEALLEGALSIGMQTSRDVLFAEYSKDILYDSVEIAGQAYRASLTGTTATTPTEDLPTSGFLMRSALVAGWPGLSVKGLDANGDLLQILRMELLSSNVLLVLFYGIPEKLEISEPQEGFRFGVDEQGEIELRSVESATLGNPLGTLAIRDLTGATNIFMRAGTDGRVLNLAPTSSTGLVQALESHLSGASNFGPADFALQMVKSPEQQTFNPPGA